MGETQQCKTVILKILLKSLHFPNSISSLLAMDSKYINDIVPSPVADNTTIYMDAVDNPRPESPWRFQHQPMADYDDPPRSPKRQVEDPSDGPPSPKSPRHVPCLGGNIGMLVSRVRNVRIVAYAPETCV